MVGIVLLALLLPSVMVGPFAVQHRDLQVVVAAWATERLPSWIGLPSFAPVWSPHDEPTARAVEEVAGRPFHRHVRIVERHLEVVDGSVPGRVALTDRPGGRAATERAWGVGPRPRGSDRSLNGPESSYIAVGRYLPGADLVEIDPRAAPLRTAVLAHELAHALADQHGGARGGNRLATEGFAGLIEGRIVAEAAWRSTDDRIPAEATYRDLSTFWLPYVAAPLAFEIIEQAAGDAAIWTALRERSGRAVLTPHRWAATVQQDRYPTPPPLEPVDDVSEVVSLRTLDPGHWLIVVGQYHAPDTAVQIAAGVVETVEFAYLDAADRTCIVATVLVADRRTSGRLHRSLRAWVAEHDSRDVVALDATALQVTGCDPGARSSAAWLDPRSAATVQHHIDRLRGLTRTSRGWPVSDLARRASS